MRIKKFVAVLKILNVKKSALKTKFKEKMKKLIVDHYLLKNTPFGIQETLIQQIAGL